jgi:folate-dependent tRNA-U54 methylase TrmFO/GidA
VQLLQCSHSLEAIDANQNAEGQIKHRIIRQDSLLLDDAEIIRCLDDKVLGHDKQSKFQSVGGGGPARSWR